MASASSSPSFLPTRNIGRRWIDGNEISIPYLGGEAYTPVLGGSDSATVRSQGGRITGRVFLGRGGRRATALSRQFPQASSSPVHHLSSSGSLYSSSRSG